jgi:hypothetical protein
MGVVLRESAIMKTRAKKESGTHPTSDVKGDWPEALMALRAELDRELAYLREPDPGAKMRKIFAASPAEIAKAANAAGRRQR